MPNTDVKIYRASSLHAALSLVRSELGPEAAVLRTREVRGGLFGWLGGSRQIEVTASASVRVPSRFAPAAAPLATASPAAALAVDIQRNRRESSPDDFDTYPAVLDRRSLRQCFARPIQQAALGIELGAADPATAGYEVEARLDRLESLSAELHVADERPIQRSNQPEGLSPLFAELLVAGLNPRLARELVDRARQEIGPERQQSSTLLKHQLTKLLAAEIPIAGSIQLEPGLRRLVALVGPTGVGKTTTIAKLAANFRLRQNKRVGLITVDTYRIAAVEQLRTYAEIMDLPMEVVSNPAELRAAADRFADLDLVLLDTAGRSPRDAEQIQELEQLLRAAAPDEVHLVISGTASAASLEPTVARFAQVGATAMILTKLDEAHALGGLLTLLRSCGLPLSYSTQGQRVPDDITSADASHIARRMLGFV